MKLFKPRMLTLTEEPTTRCWIAPIWPARSTEEYSRWTECQSHQRNKQWIFRIRLLGLCVLLNISTWRRSKTKRSLVLKIKPNIKQIIINQIINPNRRACPTSTPTPTTTRTSSPTRGSLTSPTWLITAQCTSPWAIRLYSITTPSTTECRIILHRKFWANRYNQQIIK